MPADPRRVPLTLVPAPADDARRHDGLRDWSALMRRAQDGDHEAYRTLLNDLVPYLRKIAAKCFQQGSDADDAVQDVLLTVHAVRHTYDPTRPFGPWLLAIASRRMIDRMRRQGRQRAREVVLSSEHETFPEAAANFPTGRADARVLGEAIEKLPPDQRQAIHMLKLKEMSLKEAAAASGRSIAALKVATHRAVRNLRRILGPAGKP